MSSDSRRLSEEDKCLDKVGFLSIPETMHSEENFKNALLSRHPPPLITIGLNYNRTPRAERGELQGLALGVSAKVHALTHATR